MDAEEFLLSHTVFPYATAFMTQKARLDFLTKALSPSSKEQCVSSITKNVSHGVPYRRLCLQCVEKDLTHYGETYWRRHHHLPGALICREHGTVLRLTNIELRGGTQCRDSLLPHMVDHRAARTSIGNDKLSALSDYSHEAMTWSSPPVEGLQHAFRTRSLELGYRLASGDVATRALSQEVQNYFGTGLLEDAGCSYSKRSPWPDLMVRLGTTVPFATVKYVLMETFLLKAGAFEGNVRTGHIKPGKKPLDTAKMDALLFERLKTAIQIAAVRKKRLTTTELLSRVGSLQMFRHKRSQLPRSASLIKEFLGSDLSERQVGGREYWRKRFPKRFGAAT